MLLAVGLVLLLGTLAFLYMGPWTPVPEEAPIVLEPTAPRAGSPVPANPDQEAIAREFARAVIAGNRDAVEAVLDHGADPNTEIAPGESALSRAAWRGDTSCAASLLAHGAAVDVPDHQGSTPLIWAASNGHLSTVRLLIQYGADVDHQDYRGLTALMHAAWNGHSDVATALIEAGANPELTDRDDHGLSYFAHESRRQDVIDFVEHLSTRSVTH